MDAAAPRVRESSHQKRKRAGIAGVSPVAGKSTPPTPPNKKERLNTQNYTTTASQLYKLIAEIPTMMAAATTLEDKLRVGELTAKLRGSLPQKSRRGKPKGKMEKAGFA
jgi:hypothetical protein